MKRLLLVLAVILLLCSCSVHYDYTNGVALRLREIEGDKYTAVVRVDMAFEDGSRPVKLDAETLTVKGVSPVLNRRGTQDYPEDTSKNVVTLTFSGCSLDGVNNKECKLIVQNIKADGREYPGQWELPFTIQNKEQPALFIAEPVKADEVDGITVKRIEVTPYSIYIEAEGKKAKDELKSWDEVEVLLANGKKIESGNMHGEVESEEPFTRRYVNRFSHEIDVDSVAGLILDDVEYTLNKS